MLFLSFFFILVPSPKAACGDNLEVDESLLAVDEKLVKLDNFVNENETKKDEECNFTNELLDNLTSEFRSSTNFDDVKESFLANLKMHLLNEDWCICDSIGQNDKFIAVPLGNSTTFLVNFRLEFN